MATPNINLTLPPYNSQNWNTPTNNNFTILDQVLGGNLSVPITGDYALSQEQLQNRSLVFSGTIGTNNAYIVFPNGIGGSWIVSNNLSGSTGTISLRTAGYKQAPVIVPPQGSTIVYSDGKDIYSAVSGSEGAYLPLVGGTISGPLSVQGKFSASTSEFTGTAIFQSASFDNISVTSGIELSSSTVGLKKLSLAGASFVGSEVLAAKGSSVLDGDVNMPSGSLTVAFGGLTVKNSTAVNSLNGGTTVPNGAALTIKSGATFTVEDGARLALSGVFSPTSVNTGDVKSSTGVTVTGSGGVDAGSGGFKTAGGVNATGDSTFGGKITANGFVTCNAGLATAGYTAFYGPTTVFSNGGAAVYFAPNSGTNYQSAVADVGATVGLFDNTFTKFAVLNKSTGKFTASGGVGISVNSPVTESIARAYPQAVSQPSGYASPVLDIEVVLAAMIDEIVALRGR